MTAAREAHVLAADMAADGFLLAGKASGLSPEERAELDQKRLTALALAQIEHSRVPGAAMSSSGHHARAWEHVAEGYRRALGELPPGDAQLERLQRCLHHAEVLAEQPTPAPVRAQRPVPFRRWAKPDHPRLPTR